MNGKAKILHFQVLAGLEQSSIVKVDIPAFADSLGVSLRSAQRYVQTLEERAGSLPEPEYTMMRRAHDKARYFVKPGEVSIGKFLVADDWQEMSNDTNDINDSLSYIYIYI